MLHGFLPIAEATLRLQWHKHVGPLVFVITCLNATGNPNSTFLAQLAKLLADARSQLMKSAYALLFWLFEVAVDRLKVATVWLLARMSVVGVIRPTSTTLLIISHPDDFYASTFTIMRTKNVTVDFWKTVELCWHTASFASTFYDVVKSFTEIFDCMQDDVFPTWFNNSCTVVSQDRIETCYQSVFSFFFNVWRIIKNFRI